MITRHTIAAALCILGLTTVFSGCTTKRLCSISVANDLPEQRTEEMAEVSVDELRLPENTPFKLLDADKNEVPYQLTHDRKLIFPINIGAGAVMKYTVAKGRPAPVDTIATGRRYPERLDDMAWENDKAAYRAYGPALQARRERSFGYDIINKSVPYPVMEKRYAADLDPVARRQVAQWRKEGLKAKADSLARAMSYHIDHGDGMDCYSVGATLGGGTAALMIGDSIVYPYCWDKGEVLDNGPLRFTTRLTYKPTDIDGSSNVVETRVISLDKGAHLNKTVITYDNLSKPMTVAAGIVLHKENMTGYRADAKNRYISYADSTDKPKNNNGLVLVGAAFASTPDKACAQWFTPAQRKNHSGAMGHVLAMHTYKPGQPFTYYWGSAWSKHDIHTYEAWNLYLEAFTRRLKSPLRITISK